MKHTALLLGVLGYLSLDLFGQVTFARPAKRAPGTQPRAVIGLEGLELFHGAVDQLGKTGLPQIDFEALAQSLRLTPFMSNEWGRKGTGRPAASRINLTPAELLDVARLAIEAVRINADAQREMSRQRREMAKRGIAEVPASTAACRYNLNLGDMGNLVFDFWGEFQIDRRYVKPGDMAVIHKLEAYYRKAFASSSYARTPARTTVANRQPIKGPAASTSMKLPEESEGEIMEAAASLSPMTRPESNRKRQVPIFRGFEDARYQQHDALIVRLVKDFNANKVLWIGGTPAQAVKVPNLTPALVKSHMIEETGGNGPMSKAAWPIDPEQVNVPGDWSDAKIDLGLTKPVKRNEGTAEGNVRAAIKFLARKGFGKSGQATRKRPEGFFDGWPVALQRYNARRDRTVDNRYYSDAYSEKIRKRAENPNLFVPIEIKLATKLVAAAPKKD